MLKKQKEEFDNELSELQNTVERMEQNAAKREQAPPCPPSPMQTAAK